MPYMRRCTPRSVTFVLVGIATISALTACATGSTSGATSPVPSATSPVPSATTVPPTTPPPTTPGGSVGSGPVGQLLSLTVTRSGGIAGAMDELVIGPDGSWTFTNRKTAATQRGTL